jgi:hypothetical protein
MEKQAERQYLCHEKGRQPHLVVFTAKEHFNSIIHVGVLADECLIEV